MKIKKTYLYQILLVLFLIRQLFVERIFWSSGVQRTFLRIGNLCFISIIIIGIFLYLIEMYDSKDYVYYCIMFPIIIGTLFLSYVKIDNFDLLLTVFLVLLGKNINYLKVVKTYFITMSLILVFVIIGSHFNITLDWIVTFAYGTGHSLGFNHPNNLGIMILSIVASWLYLHPNVKWIIVFVISIFASFVVWKVAAARTSAILLLAIPWVVILIKLMIKFKLQHLLKWEFAIIIFAFMVSFYLMFKVGLRGSINNFESRFYIPYLLYNQYGINLLGSKIPLVGSYEALLYKVQSIILDNAYFRVLLINGILSTLIFVGFYAILIRRAYEYKRYILLIIIMLFVIEGFMEQFFLYAEFNFTILATFANLTSFRIKDEKYEKKFFGNKRIA